MFCESRGKGISMRHMFAFGLATLWIVAFFISPAYADSTFLLQLGTFNTEAQATQKWDEVKGKNADILGNMTLHVAEVALPPDNTITYRTQIGPITSHDQAATLCGTLQGRGVDCFVVETALFTGEQLPVSTAELAQQPPAASVTSSPPSPTPSTVTEVAPAPAVSAVAEPVPATAPSAPPAPVAAPVPLPTAEVAPPPPMPITPAPATSAVSQAQTIASGGQQPAFVPPPPPPAPTPETLPWSPSSAAPPPPPPAPTALTPGSMIPGREPHMLGAPPPAPPAFVPPPESVAPPPPREPGFFDRLFGRVPPPQVSQMGNVGEVHVAEAIRVPLGSGIRLNKNVVPNLPAVHGLGGSPSQSSGQKTYWAQLSYFQDEDAARGFYEEFHSAYPQFSEGTRVRITRPYANSSMAGHISLRVGPFSGTQDVRTICAAGTARGLRCIIVSDIGSSEMGSVVRIRHTLSSPERAIQHSSPAYSSANGSVEASAATSTTEMYWAQIGSYRSTDDAWDTWKDLQEDHKKLLGRVHASVTSPPMSSAARSVYRLRAGPFVSETKANALCEGLQSSGTSCIVIHGR